MKLGPKGLCVQCVGVFAIDTDDEDDPAGQPAAAAAHQLLDTLGTQLASMRQMSTEPLPSAHSTLPRERRSGDPAAKRPV